MLKTTFIKDGATIDW